MLPKYFTHFQNVCARFHNILLSSTTFVHASIMGEDEADGTARGQSGSEVLASAKLAATSHVLAIIVWAFFSSGTWWSKYIVDIVSNILMLLPILIRQAQHLWCKQMKDWQLKPKSGYIQELSGKLLIWFVWSLYIWYFIVLAASQAFWSSESIEAMHTMHRCTRHTDAQIKIITTWLSVQGWLARTATEERLQA